MNLHSLTLGFRRCAHPSTLASLQFTRGLCSWSVVLVSFFFSSFGRGSVFRCAPSRSHAVGNPTVSVLGFGEGARATIRQSVRLCLVHWPKAFVDHSFFLLSEVCVCSFGLLFPFGIVGPIAVCVVISFTCNRTGHWQPGSLAGVAHLLERNTDVPRTAP